MAHYETSRCIMQRRDVLCNAVVHYTTSWSIMQRRGALYDVVVYYATSWCIMQRRGTLYDVVVYYATWELFVASWYIILYPNMQCGTLCNARTLCNTVIFCRGLLCTAVVHYTSCFGRVVQNCRCRLAGNYSTASGRRTMAQVVSYAYLTFLFCAHFTSPYFKSFRLVCSLYISLSSFILVVPTSKCLRQNCVWVSNFMLPYWMKLALFALW